MTVHYCRYKRNTKRKRADESAIERIAIRDRRRRGSADHRRRRRRRIRRVRQVRPTRRLPLQAVHRAADHRCALGTATTSLLVLNLTSTLQLLLQVISVLLDLPLPRVRLYFFGNTRGKLIALSARGFIYSSQFIFLC